MSPILPASSAILYKNGTIITVNNAREVILDGAVLVHQSRIVAIGKSNLDFTGKLPPGTSIETVDCANKIIIPGLINTHAHLAQSVLRGLAENLPLHNWLCDAVWPLEASYQKEDGYAAAMLTILEMLKSGTTCFLEAMLTHGSGIDNVVRAVGETGVRACLVSRILCFPFSTPISRGLAKSRDYSEVHALTLVSIGQTYQINRD
jgi:cytosine/adenosine deaminase-related metal-dependent hydrolase